MYMAKINVWSIVRRVLRVVLFIAKQKSDDVSSNKKKNAKSSEKSVDII